MKYLLNPGIEILKTRINPFKSLNHQKFPLLGYSTLSPLVSDHTDFSSRSVYARSTKPIGIWEWGLLYKVLHFLSIIIKTLFCYLMVQTFEISRSIRIHSLKYQRSTTLGYQGIEIRICSE